MFGRKGEIGVVITLVFFLVAPLLVYNVLSAKWISTFIAYMKEVPVEELSWFFQPKMISILFTAFIFPICLLNDLSKLAITSFVGLAFMCYVVGLVVVDLAFISKVGENIHIVNNPGMGIFGCFATIMFAYNSHTSAVNLVSALNDKRPQGRIQLVTVSTLIATVFYCVFIICGYLTVGDLMESEDDILSARSSIGYQIASIAVSLVCIFSYPILMFPARTSIDWLLSLKLNKYPFWRNNQFARTVIILVGFLSIVVPIAIFAAESAMLVLNFLSAVFGAILMFLLPSMFMLKIKDQIKLKSWEKFGVYFNLGLGVVVLIGGLVGETLKVLDEK